MKLTKLKFLFFGIVFLLSNAVSATHIIGGQIQYKKINELTVEVKFVGYRDQNGVLFGQGILDFGDGNLHGDDPNETIPWDNIIDLGNGIERWEFTLLHVYAGSGYYTVSYLEEFATGAVLNTSADNEVFYTSALVPVDSFLSINQSPVKSKSPDFVAVSGQAFITNLGMKDEDGDSLSYRLASPAVSAEEMVKDYMLPTDPLFYNDEFGNETGDERAKIQIDPISGNLKWDAPGQTGRYLIAIKTEEWRKVDGDYLPIGNTTLTYIVEVLSLEKTHSFAVPDAQCHSAEADFTEQIVIQNPQSKELTISIYSAIEELTVNGLSLEDWNQSGAFGTEEINLEFQLDAEFTPNYSTLESIIIQVTGNYSNDQQNAIISTSASLSIGFDCENSDLIVSGVELRNAKDIFNLSKGRLGIKWYREEEVRLTFFDVNGSKLLDQSILLQEGDNTVAYRFEYYSTYLLVLEHKNGILTEKVLLTK